MKKIFIKALCFVLVLCTCVIAFASCADKPELDFDNAKDNLEENGYEVTVTTKDLGVFCEKTLTATKGLSLDGSGEYISITVFKNLKTAKLAYDISQYNAEQDKTEARIKFYEHILEKYDKTMTSEESDKYKELLRECEEELNEYNYVCGMWGKTVWYGTKAAVEASK